MLKCGIKERCHRLTGGSGKGDVEPLAGNRNPLGAELDSKLVTAANEAVSDGDLVLPDANTSERSKCGVIEGTRTCKIRDGKRQVVQHAEFGWANV
jgi:hypothetical protein